jgi:hypothetical protein
MIRKSIIAPVAFALLLFCSCQFEKSKNNVPPRPIGFDEEELSKMREKYLELSHTAPPGVEWRKIEAANVERNIRIRNKQRMLKAKGTLGAEEIFANGKLKGNWTERGSHNQAGSIIACDYDSVDNNLYVISSGGSIWRNTGLAANNWSLLNDGYVFDNSFLKVINKSGGGKRIFVILNGQLSYSDDAGANFSPSTVPFPVAWGGNSILQSFVLKNSGNKMYLLAYIWDNVSWSPKLALYISQNEGVSFTRFQTLTHDNRYSTKMVNPHNTNDLYLFDAQASPGNINFYAINGTTLSLLNSVAQPEVLVNIQLAGTLVGSTLGFYFMVSNSKVYQSTNAGASWALKGTLPQNSWDRLEASNTDVQKVYTGGVEAMRSYDAGQSWTVVNAWFDYYGNITGKLHADIMNFAHYKKSDGTPFTIINTHGGVAISYNNLLATTNLSVNGLHSAQYYDILTALDNPNYIYGGTQDQGMHKNTTALTPGLLSFDQTISGDYGYITLADVYKTLYCQYPGGSLYIFNHPVGNYLQNWTMPGMQKPNYGWMLPAKNVYNPVSDTILIAGGNINGGDGSYLCRVSMKNTSPYTVTASQYNFNFRANSNNGSSGITAIEVCPLQPERMYVATEDGTFFFSANSGLNWTKSTTFSVGGGWYLYGSTILSSRFQNNVVWYGGSGYQGSSVFKSTDGGQTFVPMSNGLPSTLVHEIVSNLNESMLFAATDAGPYVYIAEEDKWYPMLGADNPVQLYTAVEYISSINTVRFATFGRGIFDFAIKEPVVYYFYGNGNWSDATQWVNQLVPPASLTGKHEIFINPYGECVLNVNQAVGGGAKVTVAANKKLKVNGNVQLKQ